MRQFSQISPIKHYPGRLCVVIAAAALTLLVASGASAQPSVPSERNSTPEGAPASPTASRDMDQVVASALYERAQELYRQGDIAGAKMLLVESLERSATGQRAGDARALLARANRKLGLPADDRTVPLVLPPARGAADTLDPFAGRSAADEPMDPYADAAGEPMDPYADSGLDSGDPGLGRDDPLDDTALLPPLADDLEADRRRGRGIALLHGGLIGLSAGLALGGPTDPDQGGLRGSALLLGLVGAGGGMLSGHFLARKYRISDAQATAVSWFGVWGGTAFAYLSDLATGVGDSTASDIMRGMAVGEVVGTLGGIWFASKYKPTTGDVAMVNSLGLYGMTSGLLLGVAMDPLESEGYSINALLGQALGIAVGLYAADRVDTSRRRMFYVDLGATAGALLPWLLLYPAMADNDNGAQVAGLFSAIGLMAGGYITWRITKKMDQKEQIGRKRMAEAPVPGLIQRSADGQWGAGMVVVRPLVSNPALASDSGPAGLGMDILGGRF